MGRREQYIALELSGESLERFVADLRDKLLNEFWPDLPESNERNQIKSRLEKNILSAFDFTPEEVQAT